MNDMNDDEVEQRVLGPLERLHQELVDADRQQHVHSLACCAADVQGSRIWWLCGHRPMFTQPHH
jgi:hypothetical protein